LTDDPTTQMKLWAIENREGFDRFLDEVDRLLHNVVSAAMSLREHSYRVRDKWLPSEQGDDLREQHDGRVTQVFAESRTAQLVEGLRIIVQHRKLPRLLGSLSYDSASEVFESSFHLDRDGLLEWDGWSADIRAYLEQGEEDLDVAEIVTEYREAVVGFHGWFESAVEQRNSAALQRLEDERRELSEYRSSLFGPAISDPPFCLKMSGRHRGSRTRPRTSSESFTRGTVYAQTRRAID
jgi:hypothetical protein